MPHLELSNKDVQFILRDQANRAVDAAFKKIAENQQSRILIASTLKSELKRILKGEIVYR